MNNSNENKRSAPIPNINRAPQTVILSSELKRRQLKQTDSNIETPQQKSKLMLMFILGMVERVDFAKTSTITLGRYDQYSKTDAQLDLTDYDAIKKGVSREHCMIEIRDNQFMVTDLGSTNGTFIASNRLVPHQPEILPRGIEVVVGRLPIQIVPAS